MALDSEKAKIAHLLRRAGLGASPAELEHYLPLGYAGTVDALLDFRRESGGLSLSVWAAKDPRYRELFSFSVSAWWSLKMLMTRNPLEEKLSLFWSDHFGLSGHKVEMGRPVFQFYELLRRKGSGRFEELLRAVTRDPAMLTFLDGAQNTREHPNENYARELLELFTLGIGHYSEQDVQEAARALSGFELMPGLLGYFFRRSIRFNAIFNKDKHDSGVKKILGRSGNFGADELIEMLAGHPQTARHLVTKLWEYFAYPHPEPELVDRLCAVWGASRGHIRTVLREIFSAAEFCSARAERALFKSPVDFTMGTLRALGTQGIISALVGGFRAGWRKPLADVAGYIAFSMSNMGQLLLHPPTVAGWDGGPAWISSGSMLERMKLADIFNADDDSPLGELLARQFKTGSASQFVSELLEKLDAPLGEEKAELIARHISPALAKAGKVDGRVFHQALSLVLASPEYQMM
ncbi:DUF1800 domain-containing protein [bacterium]|nr:DUF1800 domain-containing protein [bacterium]